MTNTDFLLENVPTELLEMGIDPNNLPTRAEIEAIPKEQSTSIPQIMSNGEFPIIDLLDIVKLIVYWRIDGRGITVGMRLEIPTGQHDLGSATINIDNPRISITAPEIAGYQASLSAGVDTSKCELFIEAKLKAGFPFNDTFHGRLSITYGRPWPQPESGAIVPEGITAEIADNIRNAPGRTFEQPRPGFIQNDRLTSTVVQTMLWLVNGLGYIDSIRLTAETLQASNPSFDVNDLVFAVGVAGQGGVGLGVQKVLGLYITGGGEVGWFGSNSILIGAILSISVGVPVYIFWTGTKGFAGVSFGANITVGKSLGPKFPLGFGVTISIYWSATSQTALPGGFCFAISFGIAPVPVQGYGSFGYRYIGQLAQVWGSPTDFILNS